jgi:hypothetical protein
MFDGAEANGDSSNLESAGNNNGNHIRNQS